MKFSIITLFPEMFEPVLNSSMLYKAQDKNLVDFELINLRDFGIGPRRQVDDTPYGGGDGMLMKPEPIFTAVQSVKQKDPTAQVILMTPKGQLWSQELARKLAKRDISECVTSQRQDYNSHSFERVGSPACQVRSSENETECCNPDIARSRDSEISLLPVSYVIICPHYEGYDERILSLVDHQISIGKYILTGGELPAMVVIDSIVRLRPGVLGGENSAAIESFSDGDNLEYPQYTRPEVFQDMKVPDVLLSGHHGAIAKWRAENSPQNPTA